MKLVQLTLKTYSAKVINISSTWSDPYSAIEAAIDTAVDYCNCIIVCSAGNNGGESSGDTDVGYPAKYSKTIAVGAIDQNDGRWCTAGHDGSAYGWMLDVVAPGGVPSIYTTNNEDAYRTNFGGTSASAPHVAGLAALIRSINPSMSWSTVKTIINTTTTKISGYDDDPEFGKNEEIGHGRINAYEALKYTLENYGGTLTQDIEIGSGESLDFTSSTVINLDSKSITVSGGTITIANGAEINPYICVKESGVIKGLYPTITEAATATTSGQVIELNGKLDDNIIVPSGETVVIESTADIDMNGKKITTTSGTINVNYNADIVPFILHKDHSDDVAGIYPNLTDALSAVTTFNDEAVEINSALSISSNYTVPLESTLKIMTNAKLSIGSSYKITKPSLSSIVLDGTPEINPDIRLKSGSTLLGLYGSISGAFTDGSYVEARDTITLSDHCTVPSGKTLKAVSSSKFYFPSGKYLYVNGTLNANTVTFNRTSGTWGGIKYQSGSSGSLDNCTISNASYGVYCSSSSPDIENCTISNCSTYGLYAYNASPYYESNDVSNSEVYFNNCNSELYDNLIEGDGGSNFIYFYESDPVLDNNTITGDATSVIEADNGSSPEFGGGTNGTDGLNIITGENEDFVVLASDGSYILLGTGSAGPYIPSKNSIICDNGYPAAAIDADIEADWCWWGADEEPDVLGEVTYENYLSEQPEGSGSSLAKVTYSPEPTFTSEGDDTSPEKVLMDVAKQQVKDGNYAEALSIYKDIILQYEDSKYANKALMRSLKLCRKYEICDASAYLDDLIEGVSNKSLLGYVKARKVSQYRRDHNLTKAIALSKEIIKEYPESIRENTSLFDLFNFYHKELNDMKKAEAYLDELKMKYPESKLTIIARSDWGEDVSDVELPKLTFESMEEEENVVIPEEYALNAAYPNPFNPSTTLEYALPIQSKVVCSIFDLSGNLVKEFNYDQNAGTHSITWDGSDVSSGIYLIRFIAEAEDGSNSFVDYQKVTLLK